MADVTVGMGEGPVRGGRKRYGVERRVMKAWMVDPGTVVLVAARAEASGVSCGVWLDRAVAAYAEKGGIEYGEE